MRDNHEQIGYAVTKIAYSRGLPGILILARIAAGVTQIEAAAALGQRSAMTMWLIEKGHRKPNQTETATLAKLYGIPPEWVEHEGVTAPGEVA